MPKDPSRRIAARQAELRKRRREKQPYPRPSAAVPLASQATAAAVQGDGSAIRGEARVASGTQTAPGVRPADTGRQPSPKINPMLLRYSHVKGELARIGILAGVFLVLLIALAIASPRLLH